MKNKKSNNTGFSLVELLVIVSLVSILSVSSIAGFGQLKEMLQLKEATSFVNDVIKQEELKVLRGDFDRAVIHFLGSYLIIEEYPEEANLSLSLYDQCPNITYGVRLGDEEGTTLIQKSPHGVVQTRNLLKNTPDCDTDFLKSEFTELSYQLVKGQEASNIIRFLHFNLKRDPVKNSIKISLGSKSRVEILAPYGKKVIYDHEGKRVNSYVIHMADQLTQASEKVTIE